MRVTATAILLVESEEIVRKALTRDCATKEVGKGTGMGLAIVHGIIKAYRGCITCESTPGKGASFHLFFPTI